MSSNQDEHLSNMALFLIVAGLVIAGAMYVIYLFWPYFVFYFLPFLFCSIFVGLMLILFIKGGESENSRQIYGRYRYRRLVVFYPVLVFLTLVVFHVGSERQVEMDKEGRVKSVYLEWPTVYRTFNDWRSSIYRNSPFDALKKAAREEKMYDRREMGWIVWWALFCGGPLIFLFSTAGAENEDDKAIEEVVKLRTQKREGRLLENQANIDKVIRAKTEKLEELVREIKLERDKVKDENRILRAKLEFSSDIPQMQNDRKGRGVLDEDIF